MTQSPGWPPEGWYPNPENPEQQRWWDGHAWTEHVAVGAPLAPGYEQPPSGAAAPPQPYQPQPYQPQGYQPQGYQPPAQPPQQQTGPTPSPYAATPAQYPGQPTPYAGQPGYPQPYPQQTGGYAPYPGYPGYPSAGAAPRGVLPDGARVAGWWSRVLARIIDGILLLIPTLIVGASQVRRIGTILQDYFDQVRAAADAGRPAPTFDLMNNGDYVRAVTVLTLIYAVVWVVYEIVLLKLCAATLGKLICGLRVRQWSARGPLPLRAIGLRVLAYQGAQAVPTIGGLYVLVDVLWPLWDGKKQALHDKLAGTAVVKKHDAQVAPQSYGGAGSFGGYQPL